MAEQEPGKGHSDRRFWARRSSLTVRILAVNAIALGLRVRVFEIEHYLCWGTPVDLRTFEYWQRCFDRWPSHPYRMALDSRIADAAPAGASPTDHDTGNQMKSAEGCQGGYREMGSQEVLTVAV